jgi:cellulose synthase (UDP-forming)
VVLAATAIGLFINVVPEWSAIGDNPLSVVVHCWAGLNIVVLALAAICFESPGMANGQFTADEPARLTPKNEIYPARLARLSLDRSIVQMAVDLSSHVGETAILELAGVTPFQVYIGASERTDDGVSLPLVHVELPRETRDQMITKLYTGSYSQEIETLRSSRIFGGLWLRAFGEREQLA